MTNSSYPESDPRHHTANIGRMLDEVARHARDDVGKVQDPRAETTAEVLGGLRRAYEHFEAGTEEAWR